MNKNPYTILGVTENATEKEIKIAYRELAKKYHPDNYEDSPLKDLATEKMKEVNEAYDEIQKMRKEGRSYSSYSSQNAYSGGGNSYSSNTSNTSGSYTYTSYPEVREYIKSGRLYDAENMLKAVPADNRRGEWYFLYGMIYYRRGWTDQAYNYFRIACEMEPQNQEFRGVFDRMNKQRTYSSPEYRRVHHNSECSTCDICSAICCLDTCCECMGGDCIPCC